MFKPLLFSVYQIYLFINFINAWNYSALLHSAFLISRIYYPAYQKRTVSETILKIALLSDILKAELCRHNYINGPLNVACAAPRRQMAAHNPFYDRSRSFVIWHVNLRVGHSLWKCYLADLETGRAFIMLLYFSLFTAVKLICWYFLIEN